MRTRYLKLMLGFSLIWIGFLAGCDQSKSVESSDNTTVQTLIDTGSSQHFNFTVYVPTGALGLVKLIELTGYSYSSDTLRYNLMGNGSKDMNTLTITETKKSSEGSGMSLYEKFGSVPVYGKKLTKTSYVYEFAIGQTQILVAYTDIHPQLPKNFPSEFQPISDFN